MWFRRACPSGSALAVALAVGFALATAEARAATRFVKAGAVGAGNGNSWTDAYTSLQSALAVATSGDEIWVAAGTYKPGSNASDTFSLINGVAIYGGFAGSEDFLSERDVVANVTILSGEIGASGLGDNILHVVKASSSTNTTAILDGFTITAGYAASSQGGGLWIDNGGAATIRRCTFSGNGGNNGGGAFTHNSSASFESCTFAGNSANFSGGGLFLSGGSPTVTSCVFRGNTSPLGGGLVSAGTAIVANSIFSGNVASGSGQGGAIANFTSTTTLVNCTIYGNSATTGGGIYVGSGSAVVANSIIRGNSSQFAGSATFTYSNVQGGASGTGNIDLDPLFANVASNNFRLKAASPCIDAGDNAAVPGTVTTDPDSAARFLDDPAAGDSGSGAPPIVDIGAYERVASSSYTLTAVRTGAGSGTVTSSPPGINCGVTCSASFSAGSTVTLTATPADGASFTGWSGGCSGRGTCSVTMHSLESVTASFGTVQYVNASVVGGLNDGSSWADAFDDLQDALAAASSGTDLWVAAGTYKTTSGSDRMISFELESGVGIIGGFAGTETNVSQRNVIANATILSGAIGAPGVSDNSYHVIKDNGADATAALDGVIVTGGNANGSGTEQHGAGLYLTGSPYIANCTILGNRGTYYANLTSGSPTFHATAFRYNTPTALLVNAGGTFTNCAFEGSSDGAVFASGTTTFTGTTFTSNSGGSSGGFGGAIFFSGGTHTVNGCTFSGNTATYDGGGIFVSAGTVTITNALFLGNSGRYGAALRAGSGTLTVTNGTFYGNTATSAGVLCGANGTVEIRNSILWGNSGGTDCGLGGPALAITYSDVQGTFPGTGNIAADPLFVNAQSPGDFHLAGGSPAVDTGNSTLVPSGTTTDLGGDARIAGASVDMGAYEQGAIPPSGVSLSVTASGGGTGTVTSSPPAINCRTVTGGACTASFTSGTPVTLTATAETGSVFVEWTGSCTGTGSCNLTMTSAKSVTARFARLVFVDANAVGAEDGSSWTDAYTSLRTALSDAITSEEIWVAAGTYTPGSSRSDTFALKKGVGLYGGFAGTETARSQRDFVDHVTVLSGEIGASGEADNSYHVVTADSSTTATTVLDGFTITGGNANGPSDLFGAGILSNGAGSFRNCLIVGNTASTTSGSGGGLAALYPGTGPIPAPSVVNCVFTGNSAMSGGAIVITASLQVTNCSIAENMSSSAGGIYFGFGSATPSVSNTILWNNGGGAIGGLSLPVTYSIVDGGYTGTGNLNADPKFAGAAGWNLRLDAGSPAIDAGSNAAFPSPATATDLDGASRFSGTIDIGAYERAGNRLVVMKLGNGSGTITSTQLDIDCGPLCKATLTPGTTRVLTATPSGGWKFNGWEGPCSGTSTCTVTVPASVTARFGKVWYVDDSATGGANTGTSWTNAFTDLQSAIAIATPGDDIWVAAGTYKPTTGTDRSLTFALENGVGIYGGFAGTETSRTQRNPAVNVAILSGEINVAGPADNSYHVVTASRVGSSAVLDGVTVTAGNANDGGAGIYSINGYARLNSCTVTGNAASGSGGGIYVEGGAPSITSGTIGSNTALNLGGGLAMYSSRTTVSDCTIENNTAANSGSSYGGGVFLFDASQILRSTIRGNSADGGVGGIYVAASAPLTPRIEGCLLTGNSAPFAGGIYTIANAAIVNCTITGNTASASIGGVYLSTSDPTLTNSIIRGNTPNQIVVTGSPAVTFSDIEGGFSGTGNIDADPLFLNAAGGNYRLASASPANDAGTNAAVVATVDREGKPRRMNAPVADTGSGSAPIVDMGAYEFHPVTMTGPSPVYACLNDPATLTVSATGWGTLTYQWRKEGTPIGGATGSSYTINSVVANDDADYDVVVTDSLGTTATSAEAHLTVTTAPGISDHPDDVTSCEDEQVSFTVIATAGLSYQWRRNTVPIDGATSATYTIPSVTTAHAGSYDVVVTGACAPNAISNAATLTVKEKPAIDTPPANVTVCEGTQATFTVTASGTGLAYQWRKNTTPIDGATSSTYSIPSPVAADAGSYDVVVSGDCAPAVTSAAATLTVNTPVEISDQPDDATHCVGQQVTFTVSATGSGLTYQWRKGTTNIDGATSASYTIASVATADAGSYNVVINGTCSSNVVSSSAALTVNTPVSIGTPPGNTTVCEAQQTSLSVSATGTSLTYQWRKGGFAIDGATSPTYLIASATLADAGTYDVVVGGACGPVTSSAATVTVNKQPAITLFSPASGGTGTSVSINGTGFVGVTSVSFNGTPAAGFTINGDGVVTATVAPSTTTGPIQITKGGCAIATSAGSFTVTSGFGAPANLIANATGTTSALVTWSGTGSTNHYEVYRSTGNGTYSFAGSTVSAAFSDSGLSPSTVYRYKVRAVSTGGTASGYSNADLAVTVAFTDDPLQPGVTRVKAVHWNEVQSSINLVRNAAALVSFNFTNVPATGQPVRAAQVQEARAALDEARNALGVFAISYADPGVSAGDTVKGTHLAQLRDGSR